MVMDVATFFENKTILITGATGFLAKVLIEKIMRIQPNIKRMFLLIRAADNNSASERLHKEVLNTKLFEVLRQKLGTNYHNSMSEKLIPVPGDISFEDLGLQDSELKSQMWREIDIIVNSAATTRFDERYDVALAINTFGIRNLVNFTRKCAHLEILLQLSTAYVCGEVKGFIKEKPFRMGETLNGRHDLDTSKEKEVVEDLLNDLRAKHASDREITIALRELGLQRARGHGWPNTYGFTKAMGEMILGQICDDHALVIVRPSIVTSTYKEPFPGWIENLRTLDIVCAGYGKGMLDFFPGNPKTILDVIPADMVVNAILLAMVVHSHRPSGSVIYHTSSSSTNPSGLPDIMSTVSRYFKQNPWIDVDGRPVKVGSFKLLPSMDSYCRRIAIWYLPLLKVLQLAHSVGLHQFQGWYVSLNKKMNSAKRLAELYEPYVFFEGIFDDSNTEALRGIAEQNGVGNDVFNFDPRCIDWEDYFMNVHFPGIVRELKNK